MGDDLGERLKKHSEAFEGLLSLIPSRDYYGKDPSITSTQWTKVNKKQTPEERRAARRAKLDPASHKSAKDVLDENERKRKRELEEDDSSDIDMDIVKEKPREGMKIKKQKVAKNLEPDMTTDKEARAKANADKKKQKAEKKKEKQAQKQQNQKAKKAQQDEYSKSLTSPKESDAEWEDEDAQIESLDVGGLIDEGQSTATSTSANSNASTASVASAASSSSSMPPPSKPFQMDQKSHDAFRARLKEKLEAMRAARKADGPNGLPAKNRAELIEARRKKEAERRAAKKASRQLSREEEERLKAEEQLAHIRGGSASPSLFSLRSSPDHERNLSFGRVAWDDGQQLEGSLSGFLESRKKKGRSDPKTALEAAKNKKARLNGLDEQKRKDIQEKDLWLNAKKRAQGEKVHDNPALLKKSVKRLEKAKSKSKQEWKDRLTNVEKGKEMKQKKREENIKKRKEEKGSKGKKKASKPGKKVKRPGFEGTFKAR